MSSSSTIEGKDGEFTEVVVVRHGETSWNALRIIQGHLDAELNEIGRQQAVVVAHRLSKEAKPAAIYSSDLKRAAETARTIAKFCNLPNGGGESLDQLSERCVSCLYKIVEKHRGERVILVSHGGTIRELYRHASPMPLRGKIHNTSVTVVLVSGDTGRCIVKMCGDVSHLEATGVLENAFGATSLQPKSTPPAAVLTCRGYGLPSCRHVFAVTHTGAIYGADAT
ncbi:hypothetical protein ZWY2020_005487 [Hordeum vulgare]|nr:hypothetical protein ZWY2020_005487 [Hordeum vulgare]